MTGISERQLQFRIGLFVITAGMVGVGLTLRFGELRWLWQRTYTVAVRFDAAPGVERGTPVRKNGVGIGKVREVAFDEEQGGITILIEVDERFPIRKDSEARLTRSLLGDASIEFTPGRSREVYRPGAKLEGIAATDPLQIVAKLEATASKTMESFARTSEEWQVVARNVNGLMDTHRGNLDDVIEKTAESLHHFTLTMQSANRVLGDPETAENLKTTMAALPRMVEDARIAIHSVRSAVTKIDATMGNLQNVTAPLADSSKSIVTNLDRSVANLEMLTFELNQFSRSLSKPEGSLNMLISDPQLYRNLNQSADALQVLLKNLDPVVRDMRVFTDKVARHPELIGVGGMIRKSSGLK